MGQSYGGTAYASATVSAPGECLAVTETCNANGTLTYPSGSLTCSVVDPYWAQTVALLSMDSTAWTDAKGHVFSSVSASFSTDAKFGTGSAYFASAGTRLSTPDSAPIKLVPWYHPLHPSPHWLFNCGKNHDAAIQDMSS